MVFLRIIAVTSDLCILHKYNMTAVEDLDPNVDILEWWKRHEQDLLIGLLL